MSTAVQFEPLEPRWLFATSPLNTEFMASNDSTLLDEDSESSDWLEVYNPTAHPISLNGWYLTDNADELTKWKFPEVTLGAEEYVVVFASDKNRAIAGVFSRDTHRDIGQS